MTEGTLVKWRKTERRQGRRRRHPRRDRDRQGDDGDGGLRRRHPDGDLRRRGAEGAVGQRLALLLAPGENAPERCRANPCIRAPSLRPPPRAPLPPQPRPPARNAPPKHRTGLPNAGTRVKASPLAKKIAAEKGIDLSRLTGTGPGARIIQRDVTATRPAALPAPRQRASAPAAVRAIPATPAGAGRSAHPALRHAESDRRTAAPEQDDRSPISILISKSMPGN